MATISIISSPQAVMPAYNPIVFTVDSTNKAQCSFRYLCDVYVNGTFIKRLHRFPNGANGYADFRIERILQDYLSYDLKENLYGATLFSKSSNSALYYECKFGEEFDLSAQCNAGTTIYTNIISSSSVNTFDAFNGSLQKKEWLQWVYTDYLPFASGPDFWLTDMPDRAMVCYGDQMVWNCLFDSVLLDTLKVKTYNSSGTLLGTYTYTCSVVNTVGHKEILSVGVGPENLNNTTLATGTQPVITSLVSYYTVQLFSGGGAGSALGVERRIDLDTRVTVWDNHRLWFLNHYGAFDSYTFTLKDQSKTDVNRTEFNKLTGAYSSGTWTYEMKDRGRTSLTVNAQDSNVYQSNWLTENEALWMKELFTTLEAYEITTNGKLCFNSISVNSDGAVTFYVGEGVADITFSSSPATEVLVDVGSNHVYGDLNGQFVATGGTSTITISNPFGGSPPAAGTYSVTGTILLVGFQAELDPIIIKSTSYEEKTKNKIKNINYLVEIDKAYAVNRQRN